MFDEERFMVRAIDLALLAERQGNLPVGAVIALDGQIAAEGRSAIWVPEFDGARHAEMEALRAVPTEIWDSAGKMTLYTTLEPCLMCFGSILLHGIGSVVFGSTDNYGGASSTFSYLPPFFKGRLLETQWQGPIMPDQCDPLHERLLALEQARRGQV